MRVIVVAAALAEILGSLKCDRHPGDHRRAPRVGLRARVRIRTGAGGRETDVWLRNISAGGVGLLHDRRLDAKQAFTLYLPTRGPDAIAVACEVVHCQPMSAHFCRVGA